MLCCPRCSACPMRNGWSPLWAPGALSSCSAATAGRPTQSIRGLMMCWTGFGRGRSPKQDVQRLRTQPAPRQMALKSGDAKPGIARTMPWRQPYCALAVTGDCEGCIAQELCHEERSTFVWALRFARC